MIEVLSTGTGWHVRDLLRAAQELNRPLQVLPWHQLQAWLPEQTPTNERKLKLIRSMPLGSLEQIIFRMNRLQQLELAGEKIVNPPRCLEICIDKYLSLAVLQRAGVRVPRTWVGESPELAMAAWAELGGRAVVKPVFGSEGKGIFEVRDEEFAWRVFQGLANLRATIYMQEFLQHPGYDLRLFYLQGRFLAGMKRTNTQDWRTNAARGAVCTAYEPNEEERQISALAQKTLTGTMLGIDLLRTIDGQLYVLEANAVPGWKALAKACNLDVAKTILQELYADDC